jgi:PAS domain S-box-containing protein
MTNDRITDGVVASLFESSPAPIVAVDTEEQVIAWNPAATRLFGWTADEVLGRRYPLVPDKGEPHFRRAVAQVLNGSLIPEYTARRRRKDGSLVDVAIALAPVRNAVDQIVGILSIFNDITKQRLAEKRAARINDVLMAVRGVHRLIVHEKDAHRLVQRVCNCLVEHRGYLTAWIALYGEDGTLSLATEVGIISYRAAFSEAFQNNIPPKCVETALADSRVSIVSDRQRTCAGCILEHAYAESESIVVRLEHEGTVWGILGLSLRAGLQILDEEQELITGISDDLAFALHSIQVADERRQAEAKAMVQHEQLMQADKMVALGTLVSGIGHEINNPNNFIMLNVPLIKGVWDDVVPVLEAHYREGGEFPLKGIPYTKVREMLPALLDDIVVGTWRIKRIVGELKDYARSQPTALTEKVDINEVVRSAIVLCNTFIKQHTQKFSATYAKSLPVIKGNSQRIEQVVINLIQNGCEALENNQQEVTVRTSLDEKKERVVITVSDKGIGIAQSDLKRITDPFYTTRRESGGTGLGLSIASRIARDHNGFLDFQSEPGKGTVASLTLPKETDFEEG